MNDLIIRGPRAYDGPRPPARSAAVQTKASPTPAVGNRATAP